MAMGSANTVGAVGPEMEKMREQIDEVVEEVTSGNIPHYGTCPTAAATAAKVATVDSSFVLEEGATVNIKMTYTNSVANPTLNVNNTGAKAIKRYGTTAPSTSATSSWNAGTIVQFVYDGDYWYIAGWLNNNTTYSAATQDANGLMSASDKAKLDGITTMKGATGGASGAEGLVPGPAAGNQGKFLRGDGSWATPDTLATPRTIDGVAFDGSKDITHYGDSYDNGLSTIIVTVDGDFSLKKGATIYTKATGLMFAQSGYGINVNNTGVKTLHAPYYEGQAYSIGKDEIIALTYDGESWWMHGAYKHYHSYVDVVTLQGMFDCGIATIAFAPIESRSVTVKFAHAFDAAPVVMIQQPFQSDNILVNLNSVTTEQFTATFYGATVSSSGSRQFMWFAYSPGHDLSQS